MTGRRMMLAVLMASAVVVASAAPALADFRYAGQIGSSGREDGRFDGPYGVALSPGAGNLYVADAGNSRVQAFNPGGVFVGKLGVPGFGDGQFEFPYGVAVSASGTLYVADHNNNRVELFSPTGAFVGKFGGLGSGPGRLSGPSGIAISPVSGNVYVTDNNNSRVEEFTPNGTYVTQWGSGGDGDGQFLSPVGIAVASSGDVYVTDDGIPATATQTNARVQQFRSDGAFVTKFGSAGYGPGQFNGADGIAISPSSGILYVTEHVGNRVQVFSPAGAFLTQFGPGQLDGANGVTVSPAECVYVSEYGRGDIKRFGSACPPLAAAAAPPPSVKPPISKVVNSILPKLTCVDRRKFTFPVGQSKGGNGNVISATVFIKGKKVKTVTGTNIKRVTIKKLPKKTFTVKVVTLTTKNFQITSSRTYRACRKGERSELKRKKH